MRPTLGFVGLGHMGKPMCRRLLDGGYDLCGVLEEQEGP